MTKKQCQKCGKFLISYDEKYRPICNNCLAYYCNYIDQSKMTIQQFIDSEK